MKIFVVSRPKIDIEVVKEFLAHENVNWLRTENTPEAQEIIEVAGRLCYMSFGDKQSPRSNNQYINNLINQGHESVLEHVNWSFILTGVTRGFTHQLVRHRVGFAFSQLSQQYHDESGANFIKPSAIEHDIVLSEKWDETVEKCMNSYKEILELLKDKRIEKDLNNKENNRSNLSSARSILPNATETKIFVTANARALRHFLSVRGSIPGDEEMRLVSSLILEEIKKDAPSIFADFKKIEMQDGTPIIVKEANRVDGREP